MDRVLGTCCLRAGANVYQLNGMTVIPISDFAVACKCSSGGPAAGMAGGRPVSSGRLDQRKRLLLQRLLWQLKSILMNPVGIDIKKSIRYCWN